MLPVVRQLDVLLLPSLQMEFAQHAQIQVHLPVLVSMEHRLLVPTQPFLSTLRIFVHRNALLHYQTEFLAIRMLHLLDLVHVFLQSE